MPAASEEQVPKPLTYTLMYHGLWFAMFLLSAVGLGVLFLAAGVAPGRAVLTPWPLYALAALAAVGFLATYVIRVQVLLGEVTWESAFRWSAASSWAVIAFAPILWLAWVAGESSVRQWVTGGRPWPPPEGIVSATYYVEVVVWWLSHLLSVRGLARGRRLYLASAESSAASPSQPTEATGATGSVRPPAAATLAAAGEPPR